MREIGELISQKSAKWLSLVVAIWVECAPWRNNNSMYTDAVRSEMGFTDDDIKSLMTANKNGSNFRIIVGFIYNHLPTRLVLLITSLELLIGYGFNGLCSVTMFLSSLWVKCVILIVSWASLFLCFAVFRM